MNTLDLIKSHVSVRSFTKDPIDIDVLKGILSAAQAASTSSHIQAYSIVRVTNDDLRQALSEVAGGQKWVIHAPEFLVFCADIKRLSTVTKSQDQGALDGYFEHSLAAVVDVALFGQTVLLGAESLGLGGVFIGGLRNDPDRVIDLLNLPEGVFPVFGMCLGHPDTKNAIKPRLPLDAILHENAFDATDKDKLVDDYDAVMQAYYNDRDVDVPRTWKRTVTGALQNKKRVHMKASLHKQGFFKL
jgi:nitroreductase